MRIVNSFNGFKDKIIYPSRAERFCTKETRLASEIRDLGILDVLFVVDVSVEESIVKKCQPLGPAIRHEYKSVAVFSRSCKNKLAKRGEE
ncbi:hypothetical protein NPIL_341171 [Nephila pilipes]|uniref:Uncharacterized protein n=1 Tax=Nephila pilipes TaxID=299642 RepID=A0A8X6UK49_NEPPI|nr:hypothetical protein NPIL_341171 [Nephila pilipes]